MTARIYRPSRTATQSGEARTKLWVLEFAPESSPEIDPLMGWTGSRDMKREVRLRFGSKDEAVAYAERNGIGYTVEPAKETSRKLISYSDNFRTTRVGQWTH